MHLPVVQSDPVQPLLHVQTFGEEQYPLTQAIARSHTATIKQNLNVIPPQN